MHLKLRFRHADSFGIRKAQKPNGHSIPCGQLIPKKAACVFETACYGPFLKFEAVFESLLYGREFENNYANLIGDPLPIRVLAASSDLFSRQIKHYRKRFFRVRYKVLRTFLFNDLEVFSAAPFQR